MTASLVSIHTFHYRYEADLAKSALDANGIHARVASDDAGGLEPNLQFVRGVQLLVNSADAARAKAILNLQTSG